MSLYKRREPRSLDVNELLDAIIAEAGTAKTKVNFAEQIENIRKISFLIDHRIWLRSTADHRNDEEVPSVLRKWCPECGSQNCEAVARLPRSDVRLWICFDCRRRFV